MVFCFVGKAQKNHCGKIVIFLDGGEGSISKKYHFFPMIARDIQAKDDGMLYAIHLNYFL